MKKIRALKNYIYSPYSLNKGETTTAPDTVADRLVRIGFVEYVTEGAQKPRKPRKASDDKTPARTAKAAQKPAQTRTAGEK